MGCNISTTIISILQGKMGRRGRGGEGFNVSYRQEAKQQIYSVLKEKKNKIEGEGGKIYRILICLSGEYRGSVA